jgi:hypothetical protein
LHCKWYSPNSGGFTVADLQGTCPLPLFVTISLIVSESSDFAPNWLHIFWLVPHVRPCPFRIPGSATVKWKLICFLVKHDSVACYVNDFWNRHKNYVAIIDANNKLVRDLYTRSTFIKRLNENSHFFQNGNRRYCTFKYWHNKTCLRNTNARKSVNHGRLRLGTIVTIVEYKTNTIPILMHQMRISTNQVSSVVLRPKK